ncbi:MAG: hypothetical protein ACR2H5_08155 [Ktedonobacteraceae bacterium]
MERTQAFAILTRINTLLASEGNTSRVQAYVTQLNKAGYPLQVIMKGNTVLRYRPEIVVQSRKKEK